MGKAAGFALLCFACVVLLAPLPVLAARDLMDGVDPEKAYVKDSILTISILNDGQNKI